MCAITLIDGGCTCGNIQFEFLTNQPFGLLPVRACQCSFCTQHQARYTADPRGQLRVQIHQPDAVKHHRFATETADFLVCQECGVLPVVLSHDPDGTLLAVVNLATAEGINLDGFTIEPVNFSGENCDTRIARRRQNWIADVTVEPSQVLKLI